MPETLLQENSWYCPVCKDHVLAEKQMSLYKIPEVLIFHLKRFKSSSNTYFKKKNSVFVDFPIEEFDLAPYVLNQNLPNDYPKELADATFGQNKSYVYDLFAVSNHYGMLGGGHYTAFAKNYTDGSWYEFDDSIVTKITNQQKIVTEAAYILFYQRRELPLKK